MSCTALPRTSPQCMASTAAALALAVLLAAVTVPLSAQSLDETIVTPRGRCVVWTLPVGGSDFPRDAAYSRCALDRAPVLPSDAPRPVAPRLIGSAGASYRIIVHADGTVDSALTRSMTVTMGTVFGERAFDFADRALLTIQRWRFLPGVRAGRPVRSALDLEVITDRRDNDTLPAHLEWRYVTGTERDSLVGHWVTDHPLPPFAPAQVDSMHAALVRRLAAMGVVLPNAGRRYCLALADAGATGDTASAARLARLARVLAVHVDSSAARECVDTAERVRLALPRVQRVEDGGAIVDMAGAQLPRWPFDFEARSWERWRARCVGDVHEGAPADIECDVAPAVPPEESWAWYREQRRERQRPPARTPTRDDEPVTLTIVARMSNAYGVDTLRATVEHVPRLAERAVRDAGPLCNRFSAWAPGDSGTMVLYGDFAERSLRVARTNPRAAPVEREGTDCPSLKGRAPSLSAFMLGGIGTRPRAPVTLCVGSCARRYVLDPERHVLAERPHLRFTVDSLRERPRRDRDALRFRVIVDPVPEGLVPLVIVDDPRAWGPAAWLMHDLGGGVWEWRVHYGDGWMSPRSVLIYLVRR